MPSNAYDAKGLMIEAIRDDNPVMFFFHKGIMGLPWMSYFEGSTTRSRTSEYTIPFGEARGRARGRRRHDRHAQPDGAEGAASPPRSSDATASSAEVIDLRTLVPLDREAVASSVAKTGRLLIADEDYRSFGLSGEICAIVAERLDTLHHEGPGQAPGGARRPDSLQPAARAAS